MLKINAKTFDTLQLALTVFLIASFLLFDSYAWGKISFILCAVLIFLLNIVKNGGRVRLRIEPFIVFFLAFAAYVALTAICAITPSETLTMARTLFRTLVCFTLVYWSYMDELDPYRLVSALVAASYLVAAYSVVVYGFNNLLHADDSIFNSASFANINSIAMFLALGVICDLFLILYRGFRLYSLISLLSIIVIAAMRTRKAIVILALGVILLLLFRFLKSRQAGYRLLRFFFIILLVLVVLYFASKLPIFSGVNGRLEQMINTFRGSGKMDTSTVLRQQLIKLGWFCFTKRPLFGVGMGCTHSVAYANLSFDSYLHNNYIELLAGGGIIAFGIFYAMYVYLAIHIFKIRKFAPEWFAFGVIIVVLTLVADYGRVTYYSKTVLFEIMVLFLIVRIVNANRKEPGDPDETD